MHRSNGPSLPLGEQLHRNQQPEVFYTVLPLHSFGLIPCCSPDIVAIILVLVPRLQRFQSNAISSFNVSRHPIRTLHYSNILRHGAKYPDKQLNNRQLVECKGSQLRNKKRQKDKNGMVEFRRSIRWPYEYLLAMAHKESDFTSFRARIRLR